jgi:hypothetical protein
MRGLGACGIEIKGARSLIPVLVSSSLLGSQGVPRVKLEDVRQGAGIATVLCGSTLRLAPTQEPAEVHVNALFDYLAAAATAETA